MLAAKRQASIVAEVQREGALRIAELAEKLGVSEVTIRRDIDHLSERGELQKVHGGATTKSYSTTSEPAFTKTVRREAPSKNAIANAAVELVQPGQAVALMGGSTVFALARKLVSIPDLTVVTNSVPVSDLLSTETSLQNWTVVLAGGERTPSDSLVGPLAEDGFGLFNFDIVFLGTHGMDPARGFSSPNMLEADINRRVMASSQKSVVLADHTKWLVRGFSSFGPFESADVVIVDAGLDPAAVAELREHIQQVIVAS